MYFNVTMFWGLILVFFLFSCVFAILEDSLANVFWGVAMSKSTCYSLPWPYFYLYSCYSLWQAAGGVFASILGHFMNENHGINIVPCDSRQKSLLNIEMTLQTSLVFFPVRNCAML